MKAFAILAFAISMTWGMPSCWADGGESSPPSAESIPLCKEPMSLNEEFPCRIVDEPYELDRPYDYMPLSPEEAKQDEQYEHVTLAGLTAHPERYDGKKVRVSGSLLLYFEGQMLCSEDPMAKCLWLSIGRKKPEDTRRARLLKFHNMDHVFMRGIFDAKMQGHDGILVAGGIRNIVEVSAGNVNRVVFDAPSDKRQPVWSEEEVLLANPIIADPKQHDGKVVLVYGYISSLLLKGSFSFTMCPSAELIGTRNCIGLYVDDNKQGARRIYRILEAFRERRAYVRGVFDANKKGQWDVYPGSIVKFIEIYEENGPVRFKSVPTDAENNEYWDSMLHPWE